jgi:hypothetical protein
LIVFRTTYLNKHSVFLVFLLWHMVNEVLICCRVKLETPNIMYCFTFLCLLLLHKDRKHRCSSFTLRQSAQNSRKLTQNFQLPM